jgi:hypothetical protein
MRQIGHTELPDGGGFTADSGGARPFRRVDNDARRSIAHPEVYIREGLWGEIIAPG